MQFQLTISLGAELEYYSYSVVERLATLAAEMPLETIQALERMANTKRDRWVTHDWLDSAQVILRAALESGDFRARETAIAVIDLFGREGILQFRALLRTGQ